MLNQQQSKEFQSQISSGEKFLTAFQKEHVLIAESGERTDLLSIHLEYARRMRFCLVPKSAL